MRERDYSTVIAKERSDCGTVGNACGAIRFPMVRCVSVRAFRYLSPFLIRLACRRATFPPGEGFAACRRWQCVLGADVVGTALHPLGFVLA